MEKKNGRKQNPSGEKSEHIPQYAPTNASNQSVPSVKASSPARKKNARNSLKNKGQALENRYAIPIVAIGASAGGLKAIQSFFQAMPANPGMAFIVIQHFARPAAAVYLKSWRISPHWRYLKPKMGWK